jgi:hypothetical protein
MARDYMQGLGSKFSFGARLRAAFEQLVPANLRLDLFAAMDGKDSPASITSPSAETQFFAKLIHPESLAAANHDDVPRNAVPGVFSSGALSGPLASGAAVAFMSLPVQSTALGAPATAGAAAREGQFQVLFGEDLGPGLVVNMATREIVGDGHAEQALGSGDNDVLVLAGPFADGTPLPRLHGLEAVVLLGGQSYNLTSGDEHIGRGASLTINALPLGPGDSLTFDGSAETDGRFFFYGGAGDDSFIGGGGADRLYGLGGADALCGGGGADVFAYTGAGESSGAGHDRLLDFDPASDRIDLPNAVTGFDAAVTQGALSDASFDADLTAALSGLGAGHAVLFTPDGGDQAGVLFLVVDGNGQAGYQAGADFVFELPNTPAAELSGHPGFFV